MFLRQEPFHSAEQPARTAAGRRHVDLHVGCCAIESPRFRNESLTWLQVHQRRLERPLTEYLDLHHWFLILFAQRHEARRRAAQTAHRRYGVSQPASAGICRVCR